MNIRDLETRAERDLWRQAFRQAIKDGFPASDAREFATESVLRYRDGWEEPTCLVH